MTDLERALGIAEKLLMTKHYTLVDWQNYIATAMLEFAANEVETLVGDPTFRAEELRAQIAADPEKCDYVFDSERKR